MVHIGQQHIVFAPGLLQTLSRTLTKKCYGTILARTVDRLELGLSFLEGLVHEVVVRSLSVVGAEVEARPDRVGQLLGINRCGREEPGEGGGGGRG